MAKQNLPQTQVYIDKYTRFQQLYLRANKTASEIAELEQLQLDLADFIFGAVDYNALLDSIGTLSNLTTTEKSNLVGATNELKTNQGALTSLSTTAKSSLVAAINEAFQFANDGKTAVANAITAKGVSASSSDAFSTLATKIGQISTGKKSATGAYTDINSPNIIVSGLDFIPKIIVCICREDNYRGVAYNGYISSPRGFYLSTSSSGAYFTMDGVNTYAVYGGFKVSKGSGNIAVIFDWFACE